MATLSAWVVGADGVAERFWEFTNGNRSMAAYVDPGGRYTAVATMDQRGVMTRIDASGSMAARMETADSWLREHGERS